MPGCQEMPGPARQCQLACQNDLGGGARSTQKERAAVLPAQREYHAAIRQAKRKHWVDWLEEATEQSVWQANKYAQQAETPIKSANASRVPDLHTATEDPPEEVGERGPEVTVAEMESAIKQAGSYKAPGPSQTRDLNESPGHRVIW
ncbi:hypothetical protein BDZ89DRAFT_1049630 [Hymenopellis radicata]|nr:hypothetical protein BDZ89DRAFT_1049630 [Hymenopellis radicata]